MKGVSHNHFHLRSAAAPSRCLLPPQLYPLPLPPPLSLSLPSSTCTPCFCIQLLSLHLPRLRPRACKKCIKGNSVLLLLQLARVFPVLTFFFYFFVSHCCCCFCFLLLLFSLHFFYAAAAAAAAACENKIDCLGLSLAVAVVVGHGKGRHRTGSEAEGGGGKRCLYCCFWFAFSAAGICCVWVCVCVCECVCYSSTHNWQLENCQLLFVCWRHLVSSKGASCCSPSPFLPLFVIAAVSASAPSSPPSSLLRCSHSCLPSFFALLLNQ